MKHRLLGSVLVLVVGCSSDDNSNTNGETGGAPGMAGMAGAPGGGSSNAGGSGQGMGGAQGTGATSTAGKGGSVMGNGGSPGGGTGNGGASGSAGSSMGGAAGAAGAGNGGSAGMAGGGNGGAGMDTGQSVLERNKHPSRDGYFIQPMLTLDAAAKMKKETGFAPTFMGAMWASPLYLENGPGGKGVFFAVTTSNNVYALDETTGAVVWMKNIGSSPQSSGAGCGSIHPIGILSTPVIDAASRTIYVAGAIGTSSITSHELHALSVDDGTEKQGYPVTLTGTSGSTTFTPAPQNQRSALSLVNGIVYVAFGGHVGDCGNYHGWVFGVDTKDPTKKGGWATLGAKGEGIWASGGMASDGNGVFAVTGNNTAGATDHMMSDSEEVVRITGLGVLNRSNQNLYFPSSWRSMDTGDQDFGSASPVYISVGSAHYVAAISKNGHLYLLDPANLGGMAGHVLDYTFGGSNSVHTAPGSYTTAMGTYVVLGTDNGAMCPGGGGGSRVVSIRITAGSPPKAAVAWCATNGGGVPGPIATSTDGMANAVVWYMSGSALRGVNGDTGADIYTSAGGDACSGVQQWTSPIAVKGRIVTGANGKLCSYSPQ